MPHPQVPLAERLEAFAQLLRRTVQEAGGHAHALLPRLAVTFVTTQLQVRALAGQERVLQVSGGCGGGSVMIFAIVTHSEPARRRGGGAAEEKH